MRVTVQDTDSTHEYEDVILLLAITGIAPDQSGRVWYNAAKNLSENLEAACVGPIVITIIEALRARYGDEKVSGWVERGLGQVQVYFSKGSQ